MFELKRLKNLGVTVALLLVAFLYNAQAVPNGSGTSHEVASQSSDYIKDETSAENFVIDHHGVLTSYDGYARKIIIPEGVKEIAYGVFMEKQEIEDVVFPEGLTYIDEYAFYGCVGIKNFALPESLESIGRLAFGDCRGIMTLYIGKNMKKLDEFAAWGCESLTDIYVSEENPYFSENGGVLYNKDLTELLICPNGKDGTVTIPESVKSIREYAFFDCIEVDKIIFGSSVKSIGEAAFYGCKDLKEVQLNENLESIGSCAFAECVSLKEFVVEKNVKFIGSSAFTKCISLEKVKFLSKNVEIGHKIFFKSKAVKILGFAGSTAEDYAKNQGSVFEAI